ncbi:hypothetical protein KDL01_00555 [Actinospica durhamensis]|uniref:Secreted protein n=1 Tax=Actinospica durhamensis TaxID=1508375 RepID=A0A941EI74_9ACTN|nr:hypothetical protein [Actinospica durhamensis]MBR7831726.1 hypothetical protein [Actinospica durhamensis]
MRTRGRIVLGTSALALMLGAGVGMAIPASADSAGDTQQSQLTAPNAVTGYEIVRLGNANVGNFERRNVYCPEGKKAIGGGAEAQGVASVLNGSFPTDDGRGWVGLGHQPGYNSVGISVYAVCAYV